MLLELWARIGLTATGLVLALVVRPRLGRFVARRPGAVLPAIAAVVLAVVAAHYVLTWTRPTSNWLFGGIEPLRRADARLGWTFVPGRSGQKIVGGRTIDFTFDSAGYRVRRLDEPGIPRSRRLSLPASR